MGMFSYDSSVYTLYLIEKDIRFCVLYKIGFIGVRIFQAKKKALKILIQYHLRKRQVSK